MKWIVCTVTVLALAAALPFASAPAWAQAEIVTTDFQDIPFDPKASLSDETLSDFDRFTKQNPSTFHFLKIAPTARLESMGEAFTAVADGMDAIYYNPAGIAGIENFGWSFGGMRWFGEMDYRTGAVAVNTPIGVVGLSVITLSFPDVEQTTSLAPEGTGQMLDLGDTGIGFHYAYQMTDKLGAGVQLRYVKSELGLDEEVTAVLLSAGTLMHTGFESLRIGMGIKNLGNDVSAIDIFESSQPVIFNLGLAGEVMGNIGDPTYVTVAFEGAYHTDSWQRYHVGAELWFNNMLALRAGNRFKYDAQSWSVGAGVKGTFGDSRSIMADVSYSELDELLDHKPIRFTVSGSF